jgi:formamidopyrimidine-DNA glycosylase
MIEIPEASVLSRQLTASLEGKTIDNVIAGSSPHKLAWYYGSPHRYPTLTAGKVFRSARAVGGMVEGAADDVRFLFSEGANLRYLPAGSVPPKKHQLLVEFSDESMLVASVRMYGGIGVFLDGELDNEYYLIALQKPSPLAKDFDERYFRGLLSPQEVEKMSVKAFLATEQRIPGFGNGVLQDVLYRARMNPKRKLGEVDDEGRRRLFEAVTEVLREITDGGGRDTELDLYGEPGGYRTIMSRNTVNEPCPSCGCPIKKTAYMGGSVYFCPECQPV